MQQSAAMDVIESIEYLHRHIRRERQREAPVRFAPLAHGRAVDELRDHVASAFGDEEIVDGGDVAMVNLRRHLRFAQKASAEDVVGEESLLHDFDAAEGVEVDVARLEDLSHPSRAEEVQNFVLAVE